MRDLLDFLDEPSDVRVLGPILATSIGRWRHELPAEDVRAIGEIAETWMGRLGYGHEVSLRPAVARSSVSANTGVGDRQSHMVGSVIAGLESPRGGGSIAPIFIGGQRRSGTSLMRVLLNRHPNIACGPESKFVQDPRFREWHERLAAEWCEPVRQGEGGAEAIDRAMAALVNRLFTTYRERQGKGRWAEKTPTNIQRIDYLFRLFPDAQFVHVIRDPRDSFCSIRERMGRDKPEWAKFTPKRTARDWVNTIEAGERRRSETARYIEVRYEDLVVDPENALRRVLEFLGESWDECVLDPRSDNQEARTDRQVRAEAIVPSSVGRWRSELNGAEVARIERVAGQLMRRLGYELAGERAAGVENVAV
jgi:hypothetical protein